MKNLTFLKRVLWLLIPLLTMFNSRMYADAFEGFENFSTSTSYTSQLDWSNAKADLDWRSRYGAVTTSSKRSGSNGFLLRNYKNSGNKGWLVTRTTLQNVTSITYYKKVTNTGVQHKVCYSTDGSNWTNITTGITGSTSAWGSQTITVPAAVQASALYFRWEITSTNTTGSNRDLYIDDITFTVDAGSVATPSFNNGTGTYNNDVSVTISCATAGATIHYRTDGTAPTCSTGTTGTSVTISSTGTVLKAIACKDGSTDSEVATATYTLKCATPTGLTTDTYVGTQTVTLATTTAGADIYYTTDGSNPTASSTHYTAPFSVSSTSTIKAIASKSNYVNSDIASATYTITPAYVVTWKNQGTTVTTTNVASGSQPVFPDMSGEAGCQTYTYFYGWAEGTWSGEVSSPGTSSTVKVYRSASEMPNVTGDGVVYHAVWGDSPAGYTLVESNLGTDWAGDYLIAYSSTVFADGRVGGTGTGGIGKQYQKANPGDNLVGKVVNATWGDTYHVTLEEISENSNTYLLKTQDGQYNYQTSNSNGLSSTSTRATADDYPITVTFNSSSDIRLGLGGSAAGAVFRYNASEYFRYYKDCGQNAVYLYKKSSSANCVTSCCTKLGAIDGELTLTQGGNSVTISGWSDVANVGTYTVRMYKKNGASWDLVSGTTSGGSAGTQGTRTGITSGSKSVTYTGLIVESEYKFTVQAIAGSASYCDGDETAVTEINSTDVSSTPFKFRYSIYIDNGSGSGWAHYYIEPTANADEGSVSITLGAHVDYYQFKIAGGFSGWWGQSGSSKIPASTQWTLNSDQNVRLETGAGGSYVFTVDYSGTTNPKVTVTFPSADQASGYKIYFDKSIIGDWGSTLKYRIGNNTHNQSQDFALVPGTDQFYVTTTPNYGSMDAWHIANNSGQTGSTSIYYTKGTGAITKSISFQQSAVTEDITVIPTTTHSTGGDANNNNCEFYTINTPTSGMLTHTATITAPSHGTINLAYTDVNSASQNKTSTTAGLAHRTKITASATPATGYQLSTFTVTPSGESAQNLTSGATDNHILAKDATFAATFTAKTYTINLDRNGATSGSESVTMTYNSATHTAITAPSKNGYTFDGWYDSETDNNGSGNLVMNASGVLQANVTGYTGAGGIWTKDATCTLYAKWTPTPYTITYDLDGGDVATPNPTSYTIEDAAITLNNPTKTGCDFAGWTGTGLGGATTTVTIAAGSTGDRSYTATWTTKHYTVTWLSNGANYVTPVDYAHGASLALPAGKPSVPSGCSSKVFVGWAETNEITVATSTAPTFLDAGSLGTVTANKTYRAVFADEDDDEVTYSIDWETTPSTDVWEINNFSRSNSYSDHTHGGSYVGVVSTTSGTIKLKQKVTPTAVTCYYTKATTNTNNSSSFSLGYSTDGSTWLYLGAGKTMNSVTQWTWEELSWTGDDKEDVYVRFEYNGTATARLIDDLSITCGGLTYDNYITLCETCTDPSDLAASNVTSSGAKITWDGVSLLPTGGFKVVWSTSSSRPGTLNVTNSADVAAGTNEYTITGLAATTKYYVWVQSKCNEHWAGSINFTTKAYHTATFIGADGSTLQSGNVDEGAPITYSGETPVTCDDGADPSNYFVGWADDVWSGKVAKASIVPTFYDTETAGEYLPNMGVSNVTFYAVFAKRSGTPPTEKEWSYTFTTNKYGSSGTTIDELSQSLDGTEGGSTVNKTWVLDALGPWNEGTSEFDAVAMDTKDNTKGIKIGTNAAPAEYMYFSSTGFTGTITAVKVSTSGGSMTQTSLSLNVDGSDFRCNNNETVDITNANTEYSFTGSKTTSGGEIQFTWAQIASNSKTSLYIKKIEVDYTTGGDLSYSNYMTSCNPCVTPSDVANSDVTEQGATITWSGKSNSGTTGFKVLWSTSSTRPAPATGNNADVDANTKTYSITGLNPNTTYYVWVQAKCDDSWSASYTSFTTLAVHTISFAADNGSISGGSISSGSGTSSASASIVNGQTLTFPSLSSTSCGTFIGWITGTYDATTAPATVYLAGDEMENITAAASYNAVYRVASGAPQNVTDVFTYSDFAATSTVYTAFSGVSKTSASIYAGESAKNATNDIQLRRTSPSGIISTTSGGLIKKVSVTWGTGNSSGRKVDIYGKNTAYTASSQLYSNDAAVQGTKLGSITEGSTTELTIDGDYEYVGFCSNSGGAFLANISFQWYGSPMKYMTTPECGPVVELTSSLSSFTYVYGAGPSASQSFTVGGMNLGANDLVVTAPTNYEVCKTADGTYTSSVSFTPSDGTVANSTVYIRLAAGLNVGTYNYAAAEGLQVTSTGATTRTAALNGSVTKAVGSIAFTDFNAVDHYEAELTGSSVDVTLTVNVTGDGAVSYSRSPAAGSSAVPSTTPTTTLHTTTTGTWTVTATLAAGTNYTGSSTSCTVIVYKADRFYDNVHGNDMILKRNDAGEDHYTIPTLTDESRSLSGSCSETHYHFMGWVPESALSSLPNDAAYDAVMITGGGTQSATGTNYYAVWAEE